MQEIHSMGGTRFFGGGGGAAAAGGGDRRMRPHHHHHHSHVQNNNHHHHQALKCPRCDSLNTKFCYYNNYNLSQPRHFCKNCRRYWTKGGVLRNVPVGGGCRKSKRSNKTKNTTATTTTASSSETTTSSQQHQHQHQHQPPLDQQKSNSHSSSESSSLTAATTAAAAASAVTELNCESSNNNLHESSNLLIPSSNAGLESGTGGGALEQGAGGDCGGIFSEIGTFTSLIASSSSNNDALAFGFGGGVADAASFQWQHHKLPEGLSGSGGSALLDHGHGAVAVDFSAMQGKTGNGGFGPLDWQGGADQGLFDLPNAVDQAYWSHTQWPDQDNSALFHLP